MHLCFAPHALSLKPAFLLIFIDCSISYVKDVVLIKWALKSTPPRRSPACPVQQKPHTCWARRRRQVCGSCSYLWVNTACLFSSGKTLPVTQGHAPFGLRHVTLIFALFCLFSLLDTTISAPFAQKLCHHSVRFIHVSLVTSEFQSEEWLIHFFVVCSSKQRCRGKYLVVHIIRVPGYRRLFSSVFLTEVIKQRKLAIRACSKSNQPFFRCRHKKS